MKPAAFDYVRAGSLDEALGALAEAGPDARVLAGGQSLLPMLNMRLARPAVLVDIMRVAELGETSIEAGALVVRAAVRQVALQDRATLADEQPLLARALPWIGHYQTRARGTVCGSIAHADPSAELPLCLVALGGEIRLRSRRARRRVPAADFFTGTMATAKRDDELIEAVAFPAARPGEGFGFAEVGRRHGDYALAACAARVGPEGMRLAVGGVGDHPVARDWPHLDGSALDDALNAFAWSLDARDDLHATGRYRRELVRRLGRQTLEQAQQCRA